MATINGVGTTRYDWIHHSDGTAEATLWFVLGFLPIVPLKRQRIRVISEGFERPGAGEIAAAAMGHGSGFRTTLDVLGFAPLKITGVLRTYFYGFIVTPLIAFVVPFVVGLLGMYVLETLGVDMRKYQDYIIIPFGISALFWAAAVIARILDRAAGRQSRQGHSSHGRRVPGSTNR